MTGESVKPCPICNKGPKTWNDDCDCGAYGALHDVSDCDFVDHWNQAHCWKEISALREALTKEKERNAELQEECDLRMKHELKLGSENAELRRHAEATYKKLNKFCCTWRTGDKKFFDDVTFVLRDYEQFRAKEGK